MCDWSEINSQTTFVVRYIYVCRFELIEVKQKKILKVSERLKADFSFSYIIVIHDSVS